MKFEIFFSFVLFVFIMETKELNFNDKLLRGIKIENSTNSLVYAGILYNYTCMFICLF